MKKIFLLRSILFSALFLFRAYLDEPINTNSKHLFIQPEQTAILNDVFVNDTQQFIIAIKNVFLYAGII